MTPVVASRRRPRLRVMTLPRAWVWLSALGVPVAFALGVLAGRWTAPDPAPAWTELPPALGASPAAPPAARAESAGSPDAGPRTAHMETALPATRPERLAGDQETESAPPSRSAKPDGEGGDGTAPPALAYARRAPRTGFGLQVAAHRSLLEAEAFLRAHASRLAPLAPIHVVRRKIGGEEWFRIRVGLFAERARAVAAAERLTAPLDGAMVVRYR